MRTHRYTMVGEHGNDIMEMDEVNTSGYGVLPRAVKELFREAKRKQDTENCLVQVRCRSGKRQR